MTITSKPQLPPAPSPSSGDDRAVVILDLVIFLERLGEACMVVVAGTLISIFLGDRFALVDPAQYVRTAILGGVLYALLAELTGSYDVGVLFSLRRSWTRVLSAWVGTAVAMLTLGFFLKVSESFSRGWASSWFVVAAFLLCAWRLATTSWLRALRVRGVLNRRVAIFGAEEQGRKLAEYIRGNRALMIDIVGFYDDRAQARDGSEPTYEPRSGNLDELLQTIRRGGIDQVIVALPLSSEERLQDVVSRLARLPVLIRLAPFLSSFAFAGRSMVILGDLPLMTLFERPISGLDRLVKRLEDLILGLILLLLLSPLMTIVAIAIKLDSRGPIFFRQPREGFNHNVFRIWKFRTMQTDHLEFESIQQVRKADPRVTRVGRILRRTSIDELPQLLNVIRGDMSLVGPRPHAASTKVGDVHFSEVTQEYAARHKVKPGMTGWAQVCGWRGETDTSDKLLKRVEYDLFYIENWTVAFDLYVLVRTIAAVFPRASIY